MRLPDGSGLDLLKEIRESYPGTDVVMLTAYGTVQEAIRAMKDGAHDFLTKPCKLAELEATLDKVIEKQTLERGHAALKRDVDRLAPSDGFVGRAHQIQEMLAMLARVAETDSTVLIRGESGVGKELVARAVHRQSHRCPAAVRRGRLRVAAREPAPERAVRSREGRLHRRDPPEARAVRGGRPRHHLPRRDREITPPLQVKLLRVLESGTFRRLGGTVDIKVDVRVIAATNRSLETMMKAKEFREDLYYRLNVFSLTIPPLRDRREDIPPLVEHFIQSSAIVAKRALDGEQGGDGSAAALSVAGQRARARERPRARPDPHATPTRFEPEHLPLGVRLEPSFRPDEEDDRLVTLEEVERRYVKRVLEECKGHRHKAASILGISERNLYRKLKELDRSGDGVDEEPRSRIRATDKAAPRLPCGQVRAAVATSKSSAGAESASGHTGCNHWLHSSHGRGSPEARSQEKPVPASSSTSRDPCSRSAAACSRARASSWWSVPTARRSSTR